MLPPLCVPADGSAAALYFQYANDNTIALDVRQVCMVALAAIGRARWDQHHRGIETANENIYQWDVQVNCYSAVIRWAAVAGALSKAQIKTSFDILQAAGGSVNGVNDKMREIIYDCIPHTDWLPGANVPVGAMVYHGRRGQGGNVNPISHVTVHVGNGRVVGCWAAAYLQSAALQQQFIRQIERGWSGDTMITPITAFGVPPNDPLGYSVNPFWRDWPV
jgi:hypothetical protein